MYTKGKWAFTKSGLGGSHWKIVSEVPETKKTIAHNAWIGSIYQEANARRICKCVNNFDDLLTALKKYGVHKSDCGKNQIVKSSFSEITKSGNRLFKGKWKCDCGLQKAIEQAEKS